MDEHIERLIGVPVEVACAWCGGALRVDDLASYIRCDECLTVVELAPEGGFAAPTATRAVRARSERGQVAIAA
ncbi:MAG TPA: hypothetical protein VEY67_08360 [Candidatus Dormibacteraeota bacterium]|nr:hypothetical protein [Candidatus Dormibacteraeota bacterium]